MTFVIGNSPHQLLPAPAIIRDPVLMSAELFSTDPSGLAAAAGSTALELADGDVVNLQIAPVAKRLGEATVRMLAYNGSIPGPALKVRQGSEITQSGMMFSLHEGVVR